MRSCNAFDLVWVTLFALIFLLPLLSIVSQISRTDEGHLYRYVVQGQPHHDSGQRLILYNHPMKSGGTFLCRLVSEHFNSDFDPSKNCKVSATAYEAIFSGEVPNVSYARLNNFFIAYEPTWTFWNSTAIHGGRSFAKAYQALAGAQNSPTFWTKYLHVITIRDPLDRYISNIYELIGKKQMSAWADNFFDHCLKPSAEAQESLGRNFTVLHDNSLVRHLIPYGGSVGLIDETAFRKAQNTAKHFVVLDFFENPEYSAQVIQEKLKFSNLSFAAMQPSRTKSDRTRNFGQSILSHLNLTRSMILCFKRANKFDYKLVEDMRMRIDLMKPLAHLDR